MFSVEKLTTAAIYSMIGIVLIPFALMIACGVFNILAVN